MFNFLVAVRNAVVEKGMRGLMGAIPMGEVLYDIATSVRQQYELNQRASEIKSDLEVVVQADIVQLRQQVRQLMEEVRTNHTVEEVKKLEAYLTQLPSTARQTMKRPDDPKGRTVPVQLDLRESAALVSLLPARAPKFEVGQRVPDAPQWTFRELLGSGGFGEVWLAENEFMEQRRAYKFCLDAKSRDRLLRYEGEVVKTIIRAKQNPGPYEHGIVPLLEAHLEGETPWLAYEYIEGGDLSGVVREQLHLSDGVRAKFAVDTLISIAEVIGRLHRLPKAIIHRDLKPANILYFKADAKTIFRVTDFGISHIAAAHNLASATMSTPRASLGETYRGAYTPIYASPQQKKGMPADPRDDVYALGIIGYQLLIGDLQAEKPSGKWKKRVAKYELPEPFLDVLESCWDDEPEERPYDGMDLKEKLTAIFQPGAKPTPKPAEKKPTNDLDELEQDFRDYEKHITEGKTREPWLEANRSKYEKWQKLANTGVAKAQTLMGCCSEQGIGSISDYAQAKNWYTKAVAAGERMAMNNLGWLYQNGWGVAQNQVEGRKWLMKAAELGYANAMANLGWIYREGSGVNVDYKEAIKWTRQGAVNGSANAMANLGWMLQNGLGAEQNYKEAVKWYLQAAEVEYPIALNNLGWLYQNGWGVPLDYTEAKNWYIKAAKYAQSNAMTNLGWLYREGKGVERDYAEAKKWFLQAAALDQPNAMANLGWLYQNGLGVTLDYEEARKWYVKGADLNNGDAITNLAWLYREGKGVTQDYKIAFQWYTKAANLGNGNAMNNLGWMHREGKGVEKDLVKAREWYEKAVAAGVEDARKSLEELPQPSKSMMGRLFGK